MKATRQPLILTTAVNRRIRARLRLSRWPKVLGSMLIAGMALVSAALMASAATQPPLGTATSFGVLAGSAVTNTGPTTITGDLGLSPGSSVTGFPPGAVNGATHVDDAVAVQAKTDLATAYTNAAGQPCTSTLSGDLGGRTLVPGVYCFTSSAQLTGTLTLNGGGDPNSVFIFKIGSMLTTASNSKVSIINGGPCGVFWQVGSSATLGTDTAFVGTMLVNTSITMNTRANILPGRALAQTGAVTLDSNLITRPPGTCTTASNSTSTTVTSSSNPSGSGTPVTLTGTVTSAAGGSLTGSVTFQEGSTILGTAPIDSNGNATLTTTGLTPGSHPIIAVYTGAPSFFPSTSPPMVQTVTSRPTTSVALTATPRPTTSVALTATPTPTVGMPNTGYSPEQPAFLWLLLAIAVTVGGLLLIVRTHADLQDS